MDLYAQVGLIVAGAFLAGWLAKKLMEWWQWRKIRQSELKEFLEYECGHQ